MRRESSSCATSRPGRSGCASSRTSATRAAPGASSSPSRRPECGSRPGGIARVYVAVRSLAPAGPPVEGLFTVRPEGSASIRVPWLVTFRPRDDALLASVRLSTNSFRPSDNAPAVLSFQAGRIVGGGQLAPVARLDLELLAPNGKQLGVLAQLRNLLPGRYAFGLTGRDAEGDTLEPGRYLVQLTAYPTGTGAPSKTSVVFAIR